MKAIPKFPEVIDSTMLVTAKACMEKFRNEYILRLSPLAISPDLHAGGAVANGLEHFRKAFFGERLSFDESLHTMTCEFICFWGDYEPPTNHPKTFINTINALYAYLEEYPPATDKIQPHRSTSGVPAIEYTFAVPLDIPHPDTGLPLIFGGRLDMIGEFAKDLWGVDEKTTKGFGQNWSEQWAMRSQFIGYTWAMRLYNYPNVAGMIVRGIAILMREYRFQEAIVPIPQWQVDRWYENMMRTVQKMVDSYTSGVWDMDYGDACSSYGGCIFNCLCTSQEPTRWYSEFQERHWNPLAKNPTEGETV